MPAKVATEIQRVLDRQIRKVLIPEGYNLLLSNEQCQLIFASVCKLAELNSVNFSTDICSQICNFGVFQKVGERRIGVLAMLIVLERLQWRVLLFEIPDREVVGIFSRRMLASSSQLELLFVQLGSAKRSLFILASLRLEVG